MAIQDNKILIFFIFILTSYCGQIENQEDYQKETPLKLSDHLLKNDQTELRREETPIFIEQNNATLDSTLLNLNCMNRKCTPEEIEYITNIILNINIL